MRDASDDSESMTMTIDWNGVNWKWKTATQEARKTAKSENDSRDN